MKSSIDVKMGCHSYPLLLEENRANFIDTVFNKNYSSYAIIGDQNVISLYGEEIRKQIAQKSPCSLVAFPPGEANKTRTTKNAIETKLFKAGLDRHSLIIAIGGGISLDIAGFVAATFLRGIPYISIATSLLAQVDASIGGKTAINVEEGKNLIGAFHPPSALLLDIDALHTLPFTELANGWAEAIKHACIADAKLFSDLFDFAAHAETHQWIPDRSLLERIVIIKRDIVEKDPYEKNLRKILNAGHTIGHAIESASGYQISHGKAIAIGLYLEAKLAMHMQLFSVSDLKALKELLTAFNLPIESPYSFDKLYPFFSSDKKNRNGDIHFSFVNAIGSTHEDSAGNRSIAVSLAEIKRSMETKD